MCDPKDGCPQENKRRRGIPFARRRAPSLDHAAAVVVSSFSLSTVIVRSLVNTRPARCCRGSLETSSSLTSFTAVSTSRILASIRSFLVVPLSKCFHDRLSEHSAVSVLWSPLTFPAGRQ